MNACKTDNTIEKIKTCPSNAEITGQFCQYMKQNSHVIVPKDWIGKEAIVKLKE